MIDYIYLVLIVCLICFIIFIINLSYEYRIKEGFTLSPELSKINPIDIDLINYNDQKFANNYTNFLIDTQNKQTLKNNIINLELLDKSAENLENAKYIDKLSKGIKSTPEIFPIDKLISTIKSKYNSQYLSTFANDYAKYGVLVNDKCLTVNGLCKDEYCVQPCQNTLYSSDSQKFSTKRIYNANDAAVVMNTTVNKVNTNNVYPFNIFTSAVNNNCLTIGNEGLTVEKCNLNNIKQQWEISPDENICLLK